MGLNDELFEEKLKTEQELLEAVPHPETTPKTEADPQSEAAPQTTGEEKPSRMPESQGMIMAALTIGIICVAGMMCVFPALLLAPIGITIALLSRGANDRMDPRARTGCILSIAGCVLSVVMICSSFYMVKHDPAMKEQYRIIMEQTYGGDYLDQMPKFFRDLVE